MDKREIQEFLNGQNKTADRNIVIVDFANVDRWESINQKSALRRILNKVR
jgi:hypothetical protein